MEDATPDHDDKHEAMDTEDNQAPNMNFPKNVANLFASDTNTRFPEDTTSTELEHRSSHALTRDTDPVDPLDCDDQDWRSDQISPERQTIHASKEASSFGTINSDDPTHEHCERNERDNAGPDALPSANAIIASPPCTTPDNKTPANSPSR